jgi:hypothetical protein
VGWAFPVAAHAVGLAPRELLATWDRTHGGKAAEHLLRQAVLAIRTWQPEVVIADSLVGTDSAADALALHAAKEAFAAATDPQRFPEQISVLGLKPWSAKKLYALTQGAKGVPVLMDQSSFHQTLSDSPKDYAETATRVLAGDRALTDRRAFAIVAHRLAGAEQHGSLMEGIVLARGGAARRPETGGPADPTAIEERKQAAQARRRIEGITSLDDPNLGGPSKYVAMLGSELKRMPDDMAARTAHAVGSRLAGDGKWGEAREVFGLLASRYPGHPLAIEGFRWLTRYHASSEARRRTEIQQKLTIKTVSFDLLPGATKVIATSGTAVDTSGAQVVEDQYRLYSPEAVLQWHQACLDLEPKLLAYGPVYSRDPAAWLCFLAARRHVGRHNDALSGIREYFKNAQGAAAMPPGVDPWRDSLAAELWLTDRTQVPLAPKPLGTSQRSELRPLLDGKLDDACWRDAKPVVLNGLSKDMAESFRSDVRYAHDNQFLYVAVSCSHPEGLRVEPVSRRTRDADLTGHDRVDLLLDLDRDYQTYYRFQVDHRGCIAEDCWGDRSWNPKYFVAFHSTATGWSAELAIPLHELTAELPSHGRTWAMNATRVVPGKGVQTWSGPVDSSPRPEGMGLLQFRADK